MAEFEINKGIGRELEIKGFRGRHIGNLLKGFGLSVSLMVIMMMSGFNIILSVVALLICISGTIYQVSVQNAKYGQHGLMKKAAAKKRAKYIISRGKVFSKLRKSGQNSSA